MIDKSDETNNLFVEYADLMEKSLMHLILKVTKITSLTYQSRV